MALKTRYTNVGGQVAAVKTGGQRYFVEPDALGNVRGLVNQSGVRSQTYTYWPYGEVRTSTGSVSQPLQFCGTWGYYTESSTKQYVRARYYMQSIGRWQTVDPLWPNQPALSYVDARPSRMIDPSGSYWYPDLPGVKPHKIPHQGIDNAVLPSFTYGAYCGSDNRRNPGWNVLPQDCLDACCQIHDRCLEAHYGAGYSEGGGHYCCDQALIDCAEWVGGSNCCSKTYLPLPYRPGKGTILPPDMLNPGWGHCGPTSGNPNYDQCRDAAGYVAAGILIGKTVTSRKPKGGCLSPCYWPGYVRKRWVGNRNENIPGPFPGGPLNPFPLPAPPEPGYPTGGGRHVCGNRVLID